MRVTLVKAARERGFELRQSYQRLSKASLRKQGQYRHARHLKRANKETKKLKNYLGRVLRNIHRVASRLSDGRCEDRGECTVASSGQADGNDHERALFGNRRVTAD